MNKEITPVISTSFLDPNSTPLEVGGVGTFRSLSVPLKQDVGFGWLFQFASAGAVDVIIELEQGNDRPVTELAADGNLVIPNNADPIITITDTLVHIVPFSPSVTKFCRLFLTGQALNDAGAQLVRAELTHVRN